MGLVFIKDYLLQKLEEKTSVDLANELRVSVSMLSSYKLQGYKPSITVAKRVYELDRIALHPFSAESLEYELAKHETT